MSATASAAPLRYRGLNSSYVDIGQRGGESLGLAIEYAAHPSGVGCFILRFVVHGTGIVPTNFTHLTYRESAKFVIVGTKEQPTSEVFKGVRLNKLAIPVFQPAVQRHEVDYFAVKFGIWPLVTEWIAAQVAAEGFTLTVPNLQAEIRGLIVREATPEMSVISVLDFPKLDAPEQKAAALKLVQKPEPESDDDSDEDDSPAKEWLN